MEERKEKGHGKKFYFNNVSNRKKSYSRTETRRKQRQKGQRKKIYFNSVSNITTQNRKQIWATERKFNLITVC